MFRELKKIFNIRDGQERDHRIVENIQNNVEFRGSRLWDLMFAVAICSIGLNINSVPIIIGAMLISPLMGPIVGLGLSLGTNDFVFFKKSIANLFIATLIGAAVSALYFHFTPISNAQSELLSRTSPNIYDVLVAFFGGLAGIVGLTRLDKGNIIPGVAIATALMPPLCTVGYGIATTQYSFIFGALYLYSINCIFICLATYLVVKYLKLPPVFHADNLRSRLIRLIFAGIVVAMIVPALYAAYVFIGDNKFKTNANRYINDVFTQKGIVVIYDKINYRANPRSIEVALFSKVFSAEEIDSLKSKLGDYDLEGVNLVIRQEELQLTRDQWNSLIASVHSESERIKLIEARLAEPSITVGADSEQILDEARNINNRVVSIGIGKFSIANSYAASIASPEQKEKQAAVIYYMPDNGEKSAFSELEQQAISNWLKARLDNRELLVYFIQAASEQPAEKNND